MLIEIATTYISRKQVSVTQGRYGNGRIALRLDGPEGPECMATVNLPDAEVPAGHVLIKDYSENEGVLAALVKAGVVGEPVSEVPTGFVTVHLCPLLIAESPA